MPRPSQRPSHTQSRIQSHTQLAPLHLARALSLCGLLLVPILASAPAFAQAAPAAGAQAKAKDVAPDTLFTSATSQLDAALRERVNEDGLVDYAKLKGDRGLETFVAALPGVDVSKFPAFEVKAAPEDDTRRPGSKPDKKGGKDKKADTVDRSWELAFWINAHNALALKTLADAYPIGSPDEVKDFLTRKYSVAGGQYTLAELREKASRLDPRATFAMIDGTQGGPKMAPHAARAYGLNETLESSVTALVNDPRLVELERIENRVAVPPFLATIDEAWKPRTATRKWDGIRYLLSAYTAASANRNYFTTNRYEVLFGPGSRKLNIVPSVFAG